MITFFVPGVPVPKGSARAFMRRGMAHPVVVQDNAEKQKPWASLISLKAEAAGCRPETCGVRLGLTFSMPRPKAHYRASGELKPTAPYTVTKKPDLDKLVRLVLDALSGVAYADDCQVVRVAASKRYAEGGAGVDIAIEYATGEEA